MPLSQLKALETVLPTANPVDSPWADAGGK